MSASNLVTFLIIKLLNTLIYQVSAGTTSKYLGSIEQLLILRAVLKEGAKDTLFSLLFIVTNDMQER